MSAGGENRETLMLVSEKPSVADVPAKTTKSPKSGWGRITHRLEDMVYHHLVVRNALSIWFVVSFAQTDQTSLLYSV